jgi:hypothetical protein
MNFFSKGLGFRVSMWCNSKDVHYYLSDDISIGNGLWRMGILVIVIATILESFQIIICHRAKFKFRIIFCYLCCTLSIFFFFGGFICILLWTYLMNWTFVDILPTKSSIKKINNETDWHIVKFTKFYLLKRY